ncbi:MAG: TatD family hydrolase [Candidatus Aureabacteria bacterium]|nr:TatD family hydrolase [Candidatus Auribacterota bacterium]
METTDTLIKTADSHAHLLDERFDDDRNDIIKTLPAKGIQFVVTIGDDIENSERSLALSRDWDSLYCTAGFHPHNAASYSDESGNRLRQLLQEPKVRAIGEIGLDYHYAFSPPEIQKKIFRQMLEIALEMNKPVVIHNRKSDSDLISILSESRYSPLSGIIHCFDSDTSFAKSCLDKGFYISFSGIITFTRSRLLLDALLYVPLDRLLIETDCPYLAPSPLRGRRNEPAFVRYVGEKVAEIKNLPVKDVFEQTMHNACLIYGIDQ